jgi:hypothetical protein
MKIVDIRTIPLSYRCEPPHGSAAVCKRGGALLVEIETDERGDRDLRRAWAAAAPAMSSKSNCGRC